MQTQSPIQTPTVDMTKLTPLAAPAPTVETQVPVQVQPFVPAPPQTQVQPIVPVAQVQVPAPPHVQAPTVGLGMVHIPPPPAHAPVNQGGFAGFAPPQAPMTPVQAVPNQVQLFGQNVQFQAKPVQQVQQPLVQMPNLVMVQYSADAIAVFGLLAEHFDQTWKALGAKARNPRLTYPSKGHAQGFKTTGYTFPNALNPLVNHAVTTYTGYLTKGLPSDQLPVLQQSFLKSIEQYIAQAQVAPAKKPGRPKKQPTPPQYAGFAPFPNNLVPATPLGQPNLAPAPVQTQAPQLQGGIGPDGLEYQVIQWRLVKPVVGMTMKLHVPAYTAENGPIAEQTYETPVTEVTPNQDGTTTQVKVKDGWALGVINGQWVVIGMQNITHTVSFMKGTQMTVPTPLETPAVPVPPATPVAVPVAAQ